MVSLFEFNATTSELIATHSVELWAVYCLIPPLRGIRPPIPRDLRTTLDPNIRLVDMVYSNDIYSVSKVRAQIPRNGKAGKAAGLICNLSSVCFRLK